MPVPTRAAVVGVRPRSKPTGSRTEQVVRLAAEGMHPWARRSTPREDEVEAADSMDNDARCSIATEEGAKQGDCDAAVKLEKARKKKHAHFQRTRVLVRTRVLEYHGIAIYTV